MEFVSSGLY